MNNLIPEKDSSSLSGLPLNVKSSDKNNLTSSSINGFQTEYLKLFDDVNRGFVDSYTTSKGGVLLKKETKDSDFETKFDSQSQSKIVTHDADFRSVWIPKKFEGRNMFASHIDRAIFPEKIK